MCEPNPSPTLAREYGSILCDMFGIHVATTTLRHSDIQTTAAHYVRDKSVALPNAGLGHFRLKRSDGTSTFLCHITGDHWRGFNQAAIKGLAMAKAILKDEAAKLAIGRKTFGNTLASSAK